MLLVQALSYYIGREVYALDVTVHSLIQDDETMTKNVNDVYNLAIIIAKL